MKEALVGGSAGAGVYYKNMKAFVYILIGAVSGVFLAYLLTVGRPAPELNFKIEETASRVAEQLRRFNQVETASAIVEQMVQTTDQKIIVVRGQTTAGFKLAGIAAADVTVDRRGNLTIDLPSPQFFETKLDSGNTKIYDQISKTFSVKAVDFNDNLRTTGELAVRSGACQDGLLTKASENLESLIQATFLGVGFTNVATRIPPGKCD